MKQKIVMGAAVCAALCISTETMAATRSWTAGTMGGSWSNAANWTAYPGEADNVRFQNNGDYATIDSDIGFFGGVYQQGYGAGLDTLVRVVDGGSATFDRFRLGYEEGTSAGFSMQGGTITINGGNHGIGYNGTGTVDQSGGTFISTETLKLAKNSGARGIYNIRGGSLEVATDLRIGLNNGEGYGVLDISGGHVTAGEIEGNMGEFYLDGGTLTTDILSLCGSGVHAELNTGLLDAGLISVGHESILIISDEMELTTTNIAMNWNGELHWKGLSVADLDEMIDNGSLVWTNAAVAYDADPRAFDGEYEADHGHFLRYAENNGTISTWMVIPEPSTIGLLALCAPIFLAIRRLRI